MGKTVPIIKNVESSWLMDGKIYSKVYTYRGDRTQIEHTSEHAQGTFTCWEFLDFVGRYKKYGQLIDINLIEGD